VIDLSSGQIFPHDRSQKLTKITRAAYRPNAHAPIFLKFLHQILDEATVLYLQKVIGYAATGLTTEQKLFFVYGSGRNGKSVLFDALSYVLGDYAGKAAPDLLMSRDFNAHPCDLADLHGKRFVVASETNEGRRFDEARLKDLTGETRIKARRMHQDFFEFNATHKIILYSNHRPIVNATDFAFWRRMVLIEFKYTVPDHQVDPDLLEKLKEESDGILSWIVAGAVRWHEEGLDDPPESVKKATQDYRIEMDTIGSFLDEFCFIDPNAITSAKLLYEEYTKWAEENGERAKSQRMLGLRLKDRKFEQVRDTKTGRFLWKGIGIKNLSFREGGRFNIYN
jgi:putative DNA primase/helicase